jgi:hypothetical protein
MALASSTNIPAKGLVFNTIVTDAEYYLSTAYFIAKGLSGFGDHFFENHWYIFVLKKSDGTTTAPFGECVLCVGYISKEGAFRPDYPGFTANLAKNDEIYLIHESVANNFVNRNETYPQASLIETWQFIDTAIWTKTDPGAGVAWNNAVGTGMPGLTAFCSPAASNFGRIRTRDYWIVGPAAFDNKTIPKRFYLEFQLMLGADATDVTHIDETTTFYGLADPGNTRTANNIIGFCFSGGRFYALHDVGGVETLYEMPVYSYHLTSPRYCKLKILCGGGYVKFYANEVFVCSIASTITASKVVNFYHANGVGGASTIYIGNIQMGYLPENN